MFTKTLLSITLLALSASLSHAATYKYTGGNFDTIVDNAVVDGAYTTSNSVSGTFSISGPLSTAGLTDIGELADISAHVTSYSFSDGRNTFDQTNSSIGKFSVRESGGEIYAWSIELANVNLSSSFGLSEDDVLKRLITRNLVGRGAFDQGIIWPCNEASCDSYLDLQTDRSTSLEYGVRDERGAWEEVKLSTVPLPAGFPLLAAALGAFAFIRRRKK